MIHTPLLDLVISDNGKGCDITADNKGIGIMNITSRADLHQGTVSILSHPGEGYVLKVWFPIKA
jgi:signal transduction histidine kinase